MDRPIIFNDEMVRAILEGRKTQTRRILDLPTGWDFKADDSGHCILGTITSPHPKKNRFGALIRREIYKDSGKFEHDIVPCKYGKPGNQLWVREAHAFMPEPAYRRSTGIYQQINPDDDYEACVYRENFDRARGFSWRPSIHMPRWASRITLEFTDVRVERLQDISEEDAEAEGARPSFLIPGSEKVSSSPQCRWGFHQLWESINGPESWDVNPWVWVIEFRRAD